MGSNKPYLRRIISFLIIFHLIGVLTAPNPGSYLTQSISVVYGPYLKLLGLAHTWGFFAPEPISPPLYIDYILEKKEGLPESGRFPDEKNPYFFRDRHNRRMSLSKFILATDNNIQSMFVNYLCTHNPGVVSVKIWKVMSTQPSLAMVQRGEKKMTDPVETKIEVIGTYYCEEKSQ